MATIVISCPECDKKIKVPAETVGKKIRCKNCEHVFVIKAPSGQGAIAEAKTKPPAAPAKKAAKPDKAAPAPKTDDDDEEGPAKLGYGMTDADLAIRCPQCASEMESAEQVICLNCGYNRVTRERMRTRKVAEVTGGDKFLWLLPGVLAVIGVLLMIGYCFFHHFALPGILISNWDDLTATKSRLEALKDDSVGFLEAVPIHPAVEVWLFVFIIFGCWKAGKFAYRRLYVNPNPPEVEET